MTNETGLAKLFLDLGADVNCRFEHFGTALIAASIWRRIKVVKLLLGHGASVNDVAEVATSAPGSEPDVEDASCQRTTALQAASYEGHAEIVRLLLDHGPNIDWSEGIGSPLLLATVRRNSEMVTSLRAAGAFETTSEACFVNFENIRHSLSKSYSD